MNTSTYQDVDSNPYATPQSNVFVPVDDRITYDGKLLSVTHPAVLPNFCIKCGKACNEEQKTKKLAWTNPWWFLTFFLIGIFFLLIHLAVAKRLTVSYSLCSEHKAKEKKKSLMMWAGFAVSALFIITGSILNSQGQTIGAVLLIAGISIFVLFLLLAVFLSKTIIINKAKHSKEVQSKRSYVFFLGGIDQSFVDAAKIDQTYPN